MSCHNPCIADILIVGIGTAGAVLAARLSKKFSVIGFEAGIKQDQDPLLQDPLAAGGLVRDYTNKFFWPLGHEELNVPPDNKRLPIVAGETFGGGSSVNGMQYVRSTPDFYEDWEAQARDPAWGPDNVYQTFRRMENFLGVSGFFNPAVHGFNGPVDIRQGVRNLAAAQLFQQSLTAQGYPIAEDYNDPATPVGSFIYWQLFQQPNENRESSSTAYLDPIIKKKDDVWVSKNKKHDLTIYPKARVLRILFSKEKEPRAIGVRVDINGKQHEFGARKKVIICAGFQSSLYLQLSGIGQAQLLSDLHIPLVYDNPNVGRNITNHPIISLSAFGNVPQSPIQDLRSLYDGGAELPSTIDPRRSFQFIGISNPGVGNGVFTIASLILRAHSKGFEEPYYSDPLRMPRVHFNYFTDERDVILAVDDYNIMYRTLTGMGLTPLGPPPSNSLDPNDPSFAPVRDYIFANYSEAYHWTGMNRMSYSPEDGVVDSDGKVFGVDGLYVADISIAPFNPTGNAAATAFLVGNVISDKFLGKTWKNSVKPTPVQVTSSNNKPQAEIAVKVSPKTCPHLDPVIRQKISENMYRVNSFCLASAGCVRQ